MSKFDCQSSKVMANNLIAPNGKPSNLSAEQYALVRTPEFKAWFGDWENDPQNASKVVDENGEPLVVYHGSNKKFNVFKNSEDGSFGKGIYFHADKNIANGYTDKYDTNSTIYNVFLNIKKPYIFFEKIDGLGNPTFYEKFLKDEDLRWSSKSDFYATKNLLENYDGAFYSRFEKLSEKYKKTNLPKLEYVVYFPNQIKLADGSNTTFDAANPDIRYADGGFVTNDKIEVQGLNNYTRTAKSGKFYNIFGKRNIGHSNYEMWWLSFSRKDDVNKFGYARYRNENGDEKQVQLNELPKSLIEIYNNPDMRYADGGKTGQEITCVNCGWHWNTSDSDESDKYVCHKCGFDNKAFYDPEPIGVMAGGGAVDILKKNIFYHGSNTLFKNIKFLESIYREDLYLGDGIYITNDINVAKKYGKYIYEIIIEEPLKSLNYSSAVSREDMIEIIDIFKNSDDADLNYLATEYQDDLDDDDLLWGKQLIADLERNGVDVYNTLLDLGYNSIVSPINKLNDFFGFDDNSMNINVIKKGILHIYSIQYEDVILQNPLDTGMRKWEKKKGIVLRDKENTITLIAYNTGNQEKGTALYNKALIYKSVKPIRQANEIIEMLDNQQYEKFDESKIEDYKKSGHLIIMNQNEVVYDSEKPNLSYADGGLIDLIEGVRLDENIYEDNIEYHSVYSKINSNTDAEKILKENFIQSFKKNVQIDKDGNVTAYRLLLLDDISDLDTNNLGIYWAYSEDKVVIADDEGYEHEKKSYENKYIIKVKANIKNINWQDTFDLYVMNDWMEGEIRFIKNTKPSQTYYKKLGDSKWIKLKNKDISFADGGLIAPNGNPSNLTAQQYALVRTPEFKAWFGDWENDPQNASKVVDKNGEPLVVYRGSIDELGKYGFEFKLGLNLLNKKNANNFGFFFTDDMDAANKYRLKYFEEIIGSINPFFLNERKILDLTVLGLQTAQQTFVDTLIEKEIKFDGFEYLPNHIINYFDVNEYIGWGAYTFDYFDVFPELRDLFIANGYNGIIFLENSRKYFPYKVYVAFEPTQIKLADGSNTTFDAANPDVRYADGGVAEFNKKNQDRVKEIKEDNKYDGSEKDLSYVNSNVAISYLQYLADSIGAKYYQWDWENYSLMPTNYFQIMMQLEGGNILRAVFVYVDDNHRVVKSKSNVKLLDEDYNTIKVLVEEPKFKSSTSEYSFEYRGITFEINRFDRKWMFFGKYFGYLQKIPQLEAKSKNELIIKIKRYLDVVLEYKEKDDFADGGEVGLTKIAQDVYISKDKDKLPKDATIVIHRYNDNIKAGELGLFAGNLEDMELDDGYGKNKAYISIGKNAKLKKIISTERYLEELGEFDKPRKYIQDKYGRDSLFDLMDDAGSLGNPSDAWYETQKLAISKMRKAGEDFEVLEMINEEDYIPHQYLITTLKDEYLQFKKGGKVSASKTPAPKKDRVFGSDKNKVGSAASKESAKKINLSEDIITTLSNKAKEYNKENSGNKVTLNTLKAVMRRGMGAYSTSHRPTITGGAPNSRQAWGFARVNKFLKKKSGEKVKAVYVQDDDLLEMGGTINKNNLKMIQQHYHSMKPIEDIQVGDVYVIKEDMFAPHQDHEHPQHLSTRYATVEVKSPCHRNLDSYTLEVMDCDCDNAAGRYAKGKVIERSRKHILSSGKLKSAVAKTTEFKDGGELNADSQEVKEYFAHDSGNAGGLLVGKRHSEGGIKADVKSTGQRIEMEGGEAVITRGAVNSKKKYVYEGKDMTTREILSDLNVKGGGVAFADGGDVPEKMNCGCSSMKVGGISYTPQDFINLSEKEYQEHRLIDGIEKERTDHFYTLAKLNSGAISIEQALREIASKEMMIDPKYPYSE